MVKIYGKISQLKKNIYIYMQDRMVENKKLKLDSSH